MNTNIQMDSWSTQSCVGLPTVDRIFLRGMPGVLALCPFIFFFSFFLNQQILLQQRGLWSADSTFVPDLCLRWIIFMALLTTFVRTCHGFFLSVLEMLNAFIPLPLFSALSWFNTCLGCWISSSSVFGISYSFSIWMPPLLLSLSWLSLMPY